MSVIENFAELSAQEQLAFANTLVKTINSENIFTDQTNFKIDKVEANELSGGLDILLDIENTFYIQRPATWACGEYTEPEDTPDDAYFENSIDEDAQKAFKTLTAELEGYTLSLEITDSDPGHITEVVKVDNVSKEDAGIGHYEFWGEEGYDSQPYWEVEGTLEYACTVYCALYVDVAIPAPEKAEN